MTMLCFFTVFSSKFSDYLQLVPSHTDCLQFQNVTALSSKVITMSCFNYMVILGEFKKASNDKPSEGDITTGYEDFYSSMIKVPYLGSSIPILLPSLVVAFSILFALLSILNLKN
jgi:hypothetical protein